METAIKDYIESHLRDLGDDVELESDDDLVTVGFDSIGYVRLLDFINVTFHMHVPDSDVTVEHFGTVASIAAYLEARVAPTDAAAE
jgi:acyl carrier protein